MLLAAAVVLALASPQQQASAKGVFFDPESPAGKEYALPLDQAREEAGAVGTVGGSTGENSQLFGAGISGVGAGPGPHGGGTGTDQAGTPPGNAIKGLRGGARHLRKATVVAATISNQNHSYAVSSAILWVAAIVALGGVAALSLRVAQRFRPA